MCWDFVYLLGCHSWCVSCESNEHHQPYDEEDGVDQRKSGDGGEDVARSEVILVDYAIVVDDLATRRRGNPDEDGEDRTS